MPGHIVIEEDRIAAVAFGAAPDIPGSQRLALDGHLVAPGFIDIHVHGGGGSDALDGAPEAIQGMARTHARHGTTALLPTTVTASAAELARAVEAIASQVGADTGGAEILGVHLEGPHLSPAQRGAHALEHLRPPTLAAYEPLLERARGLVRTTLAPELDGAIAVVEALSERGVHVSLGHSDATLAPIAAAVAAGARQVTHLYSCSSGLRNEQGTKVLGLNEAALLYDDLVVELIADGHHLPPELVQFVLKSKGLEGVCAVTDAIRAAGQGPGSYRLGDLDAVVEGGVAWLPDRSRFAGSAATMDRVVRFLAQDCGLGVVAATRLASTTPARCLGLEDRMGSLHEGLLANLVVLQDDLTPLLTLVRGRVVWRDVPRAEPPGT